MSTLERQVATLRKSNVISKSSAEGRPSLFLTKKEAAGLDFDVVYDTAVKGLEILRQYDDRFGNFDGNVMHNTSVTFQRELKSQEENDTINKQLTMLIRLLSLYANEQPAHKVLEYLLQRYRINEYNRDELLIFTIHIHDEKIFARIVQLCSCQGTVWAFLEGVKRSGVSPPKELLLKRIRKDNALLEKICVNVRSAMDLSSRRGIYDFSQTVLGADRIMSFFTFLLVDYATTGTFNEDNMRTLYPMFLEGLKSPERSFKEILRTQAKQNVDVREYSGKRFISILYCKSMCCILCQISQGTNFGKPFTNTILNVLGGAFVFFHTLYKNGDEEAKNYCKEVIITIGAVVHRQHVRYWDGNGPTTLFLVNADEEPEEKEEKNVKAIEDELVLDRRGSFIPGSIEALQADTLQQATTSTRFLDVLKDMQTHDEVDFTPLLYAIMSRLASVLVLIQHVDPIAQKNTSNRDHKKKKGTTKGKKEKETKKKNSKRSKSRSKKDEESDDDSDNEGNEDDEDSEDSEEENPGPLKQEEFVLTPAHASKLIMYMIKQSIVDEKIVELLVIKVFQSTDTDLVPGSQNGTSKRGKDKEQRIKIPDVNPVHEVLKCVIQKHPLLFDEVLDRTLSKSSTQYPQQARRAGDDSTEEEESDSDNMTDDSDKPKARSNRTVKSVEKEVRIEEERRKNNLRKFLQEAFVDAPYRAPADDGTSLFLSLSNPSPHIRIQALQSFKETVPRLDIEEENSDLFVKEGENREDLKKCPPELEDIVQGVRMCLVDQDESVAEAAWDKEVLLRLCDYLEVNQLVSATVETVEYWMDCISLREEESESVLSAVLTCLSVEEVGNSISSSEEIVPFLKNESMTRAIEQELVHSIDINQYLYVFVSSLLMDVLHSQELVYAAAICAQSMGVYNPLFADMPTKSVITKSKNKGIQGSTLLSQSIFKNVFAESGSISHITLTSKALNSINKVNHMLLSLVTIKSPVPEAMSTIESSLLSAHISLIMNVIEKLVESCTNTKTKKASSNSSVSSRNALASFVPTLCDLLLRILECSHSSDCAKLIEQAMSALPVVIEATDKVGAQYFEGIFDAPLDTQSIQGLLGLSGKASKVLSYHTRSASPARGSNDNDSDSMDVADATVSDVSDDDDDDDTASNISTFNRDLGYKLLLAALASRRSEHAQLVSKCLSVYFKANSLNVLFHIILDGHTPVYAKAGALCAVAMYVASLKGSSDTKTTKSKKKGGNSNDDARSSHQQKMMVDSVLLTLQFICVVAITSEHTLIRETGLLLCQSITDNMPADVETKVTIDDSNNKGNKNKSKGKGKRIEKDPSFLKLGSVLTTTGIRYFASVISSFSETIRLESSAAVSAVASRIFGSNVNSHPSFKVDKTLITDIVHQLLYVASLSLQRHTKIVRSMFGLCTATSLDVTWYYIQYVLDTSFPLLSSSGNNNESLMMSPDQVHDLPLMEDISRKISRCLDTIESASDSVKQEVVKWMLYVIRKGAQLEEVPVDILNQQTLISYKGIDTAYPRETILREVIVSSLISGWCIFLDNTNTPESMSTKASIYNALLEENIRRPGQELLVQAMLAINIDLPLLLPSFETSRSMVSDALDRNRGNDEKEEEEVEEGIVVGSEYWTGLSRPLQRLASFLECTSMKVTQIRKDIDERGEGCDEDTTVAYSKILTMCMDILCATSSSRLKVVLKIDYTRSLLMDLACNAINGVGASTIRSLSDMTSGSSKKKGGKAGKKGRSASVGSETDANDGIVYAAERLGSDIQAVLSCIGSSRAIQAQKSGILLLKGLLSIDPSYAAYCISSLGSLLSSAALDLNSNIFAATKLKSRDQVRGTDIHNTEYGFAGEILRSLINIMNISVESSTSSSTVTTIIPQYVLQPFCTHFGLMSVGKKSSLIRFAVNILGARAIPAAVNILLTHALNAHSNESQQEAEALLALSMDEETLDKQQEDSMEIKEKRPFILLSRASQRKAKKVLKASSSEEYFRIATDITVRMPAQTQVYVLVSIIRCCLSFLDMTTTWSSAQSKGKKKSVESLDAPENNLVVVKNTIDDAKDMDVDGEEDYQEQSKNFVVDPFELTKYSCELAASDEKQASSINMSGREEEASSALHMMSTAPSMVLLNLEFLYEIMEHKAFHRHIVAFIDNPNGKRGENSTQALFLEIFDHLLQLIATATSLQSSAAMQDNNSADSDDRFISVQLGSEVVELSLSRFGNTIYTWSLDILKSLHRLLDTASFVGIIQELICHDQAKVRQTALMILSQRLEQTTYSRHRKSTSEERLLFLELLEQLRKSVRDATGGSSNTDSMDGSQEEEEVDMLAHSTREAKVGLTQSSLMCMDTLIRYMGNFSAWSDPLCDVLNELTLLTKNTASPLFPLDNGAVNVTVIIQHLVQNTPFASDMGIDVLLNSDSGDGKNAKSRRRSRSRSESLHSIGSQNSDAKSRSGSIGDGYEIVLATELKLLSSLSLCMGTLVKAVGPKALSNLSTIMNSFLYIVEGICDVKQQLDNGISKIVTENPDFLRKLEEFIDPGSVNEEDKESNDSNIVVTEDDEKELAQMQRRKLKQDLWSITILLRSAMAAITSVVSKVPSFAHPYLHRILSAVFSLYGLLHRKSFSQHLWRLSKHEQSLLEADINECLTTINRSIPARLMVPVLLKSTPALLNCGHAGTLRYALFLSNLWSSLDRKAVVGSLTDNSAICAMIMDYRRAYIVSKQSHLSEEVEGEIANCIVQFGLKLTETELNKLIARLGEWRDSLSITSSIADNNKGTESSVDLKAKNVYARSISFYKLMSQFGRKLKSIFVPSYASVWSHCIDVLKHCSSVHTKSVSLLVKANNKNNGAIANKDGKKGKDKVNKRKRDNDNNDDEDEVMLSLNGGDLGEMILSTKSVLDAVRVCCTYDNNEFVDESRYEATMPVVANLLTSTYPFEHLKKLNDRGEENNSSESDTESDSDSDGDSDDDEANNKKHSKTSKYCQEDGGYMNFILQYVSPCLVSLALCVGKDVLWKPLNHHVLMATRNPAPMVRMAALKTLQTLFAEVGEEYLILLPECLPFLSELMEDDSSDVIDLTSEIIRYIEELSGEKLTQYLQ